MLNALRWLNVRKILELNTLNFIQKINIEEAPEYLTEQLEYVGEVHDFRLQQAYTSVMHKTLYYKGLNMYNKMPNYLKNERNIKCFKNNNT